MRKLEDLLIETVKSDINYLMQEVYVPTIKSTSQYLNFDWFRNNFDRIISNDKIELKDIRSLAGRSISEDYMLDLIKNFCDGSLPFSFYSEVKKTDLIPMLKYFIDKDVYSAKLISSFFFPIHCSGQMTNIFLNDNASCKSDFNVNYTLVSGVEHLLGSSDCIFDLKTTIYYLNFINFESKNALVHKDSEYFERLTLIRSELENTLAFYANDSLFSAYNRNKKGVFSWKADYNSEDLALASDNLNLISYFYEGKTINKYTNKVFQLSELENNMIAALNKKEMLLCSFCYKDYCNSSFFETFDDVSLTIADLGSFISKYESDNLKFTDRQLDSLLHSFKKHYLIKNGLMEEYEEEKKHILDSYDRYCARNWVFDKSEFIDFYNSFYHKKFKTFNFNDESSFLTEEILDEVIGGKIAMPEEIKNISSVDLYLRNKKVSEREEYCSGSEYKKRIFDKYYYKVLEHCNNPESTIHYFMYHSGVLADEEKIVEKLIGWVYANTNSSKDLSSEELKEKTVNQMLCNFEQDILSSFKDCTLTYKKYLSIIETDGLSDFVTKSAFSKKYRTIRRTRFSEVKDEIIRRANIALTNNLSGEEAFNDLDISISDIKKILEKFPQNTRQLFKSKSTAPNMSDYRRNLNLAVTEYLSSDCSIIDICNKYCCLPESISNYVNLYKDINPRLCKAFYSKAANNNDYIDNSYIDAEKIASSIIQGVTMPNGEVRSYTKFDLMMDIGHNVRLSEAKHFLYANGFNNVIISAFFGYINLYSDLRDQEPYFAQLEHTSMTVKINGEMHEVTPEESATVINFLKERDFPSCFYGDAVKAYLNKEFDPKTSVKIMTKCNKK